MEPIYIAALITAAVSGGLWIPLTRLMAGRYRHLVWLTLLALPFSALINLLVKRPVGMRVQMEPGGTPPLWYLAFALFLAPITEEAIKLAPALIAPIRRQIPNARAALWAGLFLGIGFGLGEIGYLAWRLAGTPVVAGLPFWQFTGFLGERLYVTLGHGVMTAVAVMGLVRGPWRGLLGYGGAVVSHALLNLGALLVQFRFIPPLAAQVWGQITVVGVLLLFGALYLRSRESEPPSAELVFFRRE